MTSTPVDPARTSAKPALRLITPDGEAFTQEQLVGVVAGANDHGSLFDTMGLDSVQVYYESDTPVEMQFGVQSWTDVNGNTVSYTGWWAKLKHNGTNGVAHAYFKAIPRDETMQARVIGPYRWLPRESLYALELEVAPSQPVITGQRYQTMRQVWERIYNVKPETCRVTFTEAATFTSNVTNGFQWTGCQGRITMEATAPVVIHPATVTAFGIGISRAHWKGSNFTFRMEGISRINAANLSVANGGDWFDGVNFIWAGGRDELVDKSINRNGTYTFGYGKKSCHAFLTECYFYGMTNAAMDNLELCRGSTAENCGGDLFTNVACLVGNTANDWSNHSYRRELDAITGLQYTGAGTTATVELSGVNGANNRVLTAKVDGSSVGTFTIRTDPASANFGVADVVDWFNSLPGWTATLGDDTRRAAYLSKPNNVGAAFAAIDAKTAPITLVTMMDAHGDWYQQFGQYYENVFIADNIGWDLDGQFIIVGLDRRDWIVVNNAWAGASTFDQGAFSQIGSIGVTVSHEVYLHNSWADSTPWYRANDTAGGWDSYCVFACNSAPGLHEDTSGGLSLLQDNHVRGTPPFGYAEGTNTTSGGTRASLYADAANGDFTPAGELLTHLKTSRVPYDRTGQQRGATAPAGSEA